MGTASTVLPPWGLARRAALLAISTPWRKFAAAKPQSLQATVRCIWRAVSSPPGKILTPAVFENAIKVHAAIGGSTKLDDDLPAIMNLM